MGEGEGGEGNIEMKVGTRFFTKNLKSNWVLQTTDPKQYLLSYEISVPRGSFTPQKMTFRMRLIFNYPSIRQNQTKLRNSEVVLHRNILISFRNLIVISSLLHLIFSILFFSNIGDSPLECARLSHVCCHVPRGVLCAFEMYMEFIN